jgi:hypothetical protein
MKSLTCSKTTRKDDVMERIWEDKNDVRKGVYIARVTHQYDYYFVAGNEKDSLVVRKEHALEIADALQKSEGVDLRAEVTRLTVERDRMREVTKALVDTWAPDSEPGIDAVYRTWKAAYDALYPNSTKKFGKPDSALESEANND